MTEDNLQHLSNDKTTTRNKENRNDRLKLRDVVREEMQTSTLDTKVSDSVPKDRD